jgi:hypothetical protein
MRASNRLSLTFWPLGPSGCRDRRCRRKPRHTTHSEDFPEQVTIVRPGHPFAGRALRVLSYTRRTSGPYLLLILPDQSRSLIPAEWTDWGGTNQTPGKTPDRDGTRLTSLSDLLRTRTLVDALLRRPSSSEENHHATEPAVPGEPATPPGGQRQTRAKEHWLAKRRQELLPVPYFHLVFTLPHALHALIALRPRVIYEVLFGVGSATLTEFGANPRWLGGKLAFCRALSTVFRGGASSSLRR